MQGLRSCASQPLHLPGASAGMGAKGKRQLVDELDAAGPGAAAPKRRQLARRDTEQAVERLLRDHFPTLSKQDMDVKTVDGLTLRQTLLEAKRKAKEGKRRMNAAYYAELRLKFAGSSSLSVCLVVKNPNESVQPALVSALDQANAANPAKRTRQPLYNFFATCSELNQKELVGLLRSVADTNVSSSVPARRHVLEVIKFLVNSECYTKFKEDVEKLRDLWDETLALTFVYMKRERMPITTWWANFKDYVKILGDTGDFEAVVTEKEGWANVHEQLARVTASSQLGQKLFGGAAELVKSETLSASLDAAILTLMGNAEVTQDAVRQLKDLAFFPLWSWQ
jgi:hypothetical protein